MTAPNRQARRAQEAQRLRDEHRAKELATATDMLALLAAADPTATGATLFLPDGEILYIDAETLHRGGGRA